MINTYLKREVTIYLIENHMTQLDFSQLIGYSLNHFNRVINGGSPIPKKFAKSIELATKGKIKADLILNFK